MLPRAVATFTGPGTAGADITCDVMAATLIHGRDNHSSQPEADTITFEIWGPVPIGIDIGSRLTIDAVLPGDTAAGLDAPGPLDAPDPLADDHPSLNLGPVTMTYVGRSGDGAHMTFQVTCTAGNHAQDYPRIEVQFSNSENGSTGYYSLTPGCDAGASFLQIFPDMYTVSGDMSRAFQLRWQDPTNATTPWVALPPPGEDVVTPRRRFSGRVTDISLTWDTDPDLPTCTVIAAGALSEMGHNIIGQEEMPPEMDGERANRVIAESGMPTDDGLSDTPGTIAVITRDPDPQPALQVAQDAAEDGGGVLWQTRDGLVLYADANHRDGVGISVALDPCTIPLEITWVKNLEGLVNDVTLTYYEESEPGVLDTYEQHVWDDVSIDRHGLYATTLSTRIAGEGDAITRGARLIFAQAEPAWRISGVGLHLELLDKMGLDPIDDITLTRQLLALDMHNLVSVVGMPYGSPIDPAYLFIEGWTETITFDSWHIQFSVSDYCQTAAAETWDDVDAETTWETYEGGFGDPTWDDMPCPPPPGA